LLAVLMLKIILKNKKNIILILSKYILKNNHYYIYESRKISSHAASNGILISCLHMLISGQGLSNFNIYTIL
jgi:hypothetical protein